MNWSEFREDAPMLLVQFGFNLIAAVVILVAGRWIARRFVDWSSREAQKHGLDATLSGFLANIVYIAIMVMLMIAAVSQLGVPTTSFLAIIGAAGLAIGLALQGSLTNFASGVLLVFIKPCQVGDYIESGSYAGTVKKIQILNTSLTTPDNRTVIIPNTKLFNEPMINYTTEQTRRIDLVVSIDYKSDVATAQALLRSIVEADERVLDNPGVTIGVLTLAESSIEIAVRPWVKSADFMSTKFDLNEKIRFALDDAGIDIPYPHMNVQLSRA